MTASCYMSNTDEARRKVTRHRWGKRCLLNASIMFTAGGPAASAKDSFEQSCMGYIIDFSVVAQISYSMFVCNAMLESSPKVVCCST